VEISKLVVWWEEMQGTSLAGGVLWVCAFILWHLCLLQVESIGTELNCGTAGWYRRSRELVVVGKDTTLKEDPRVTARYTMCRATSPH